jgi:hypothetical protein
MSDLRFLVHPVSNPGFIEPFAAFYEADRYALEQSQDDDVADDAWVIVEVNEAGIGEVGGIRYLGELFYPARLIPGP